MRATIDTIELHKDDLRKCPFNPRKLRDPEGIKKLRVLIKAHGFRSHLEVWKEKGQYLIIAGNHRFEAGCLEGIEAFPCTIFKGTKKQALARMISDNKSSDWTEWNFPLLKDELVELDDGDFDLASTGYDGDELKGLIDWDGEELDQRDEWEGMPGFEQEYSGSLRHAIVHFKSQEDADAFFSLIGQNDTGKTNSIWYPEKTRRVLQDKSYEDEK